MVANNQHEQAPQQRTEVFDNEIQSRFGRAVFTVMLKVAIPVGYGTVGYAAAEAVAENHAHSGAIGATIGGVIGAVHASTYKLKLFD